MQSLARTGSRRESLTQLETFRGTGGQLAPLQVPRSNAPLRELAKRFTSVIFRGIFVEIRAQPRN
jgi:hypothetical protein